MKLEAKDFTVDRGPYSVFHKSGGLGASLIRGYSRADHANHVSIYYPQLGPHLFEARWRQGVTGYFPDGTPHPKARTLEDALRGGDVVAMYAMPKVPPGFEEAALAFLQKQVGKKYDLFGIAGFIPFPGWKLGRQERRKQSNTWICSELWKAWADKRGIAQLGQRVEPVPADERSPFRINFAPETVDYIDPYRVHPDLAMSTPLKWRVA